MSDKILTLHPSGKQGVKIDRSKYEQIKKAIVELLKDQKEATFKELSNKSKLLRLPTVLYICTLIIL